MDIKSIDREVEESDKDLNKESTIGVAATELQFFHFSTISDTDSIPPLPPPFVYKGPTMQNDQLVSLMGNFNIDLYGYKSLWELTAYESSNEFFVPMSETALSSDAVSFKHSPLPAVKGVKRMKQTKKCV